MSQPWLREEIIGDCRLLLGDCLDILPTLGKVDAVVTDPPYGVDFKGKVTKHTTNRPAATYTDDAAYFECVVLNAVHAAIDHAERAAIFTGTRRLIEYPQPKDIGGIVCPNGGGRSSWGFGCYHPVLFYGASPYISTGKGARPTATVMYHPGMHVTGEAVGNDHPCPKPIAFMQWVVSIASLPAETILDPFMGSGTTGVACVKLGRRFIGIEIDEGYFEIACERIRKAFAQPDFFIEAERSKPVQEALLLDDQR